MEKGRILLGEGKAIVITSNNKYDYEANGRIYQKGKLYFIKIKDKDGFYVIKKDSIKLNPVKE